MEANCVVDRISELPDSLIVEILSLMQFKDAVATTLLSRRWKNLWTTVTIPYLDLSKKHSDSIGDSLAKWKGPNILKFNLHVYFWSADGTAESLSWMHQFHSSQFYRKLLWTGDASDVDSWLLFAIEKRVEELSISTYTPSFKLFHRYSAPPPLYSCSTITKLSLHDCDIEIEESVKWKHLKSLTFHDKQDCMSAEAMTKILLGSPRLEELFLDISEIRGNFDIRSSSLKTLVVGDDLCTPRIWVKEGLLKIWAPNLLNLQLSAAFREGGGCVLDVPSLSNASFCLKYIEDVSLKFDTIFQVSKSLSRVDKVTLTRFCVEFLLEMKKKDMAVPSSNAKFLQLNNVGDAKDMLYLVEMMFPKLETLFLHVGYKRDESGEESNYPNPPLLHLKRVEINRSIRDVSIIPVIRVLLRNGGVLEKMVTRFIQSCEDGGKPEMFSLAEEKVMSMPKSSHTAQVIIRQV